MTCCSVPPNNRSGKRKVSTTDKQQKNGDKNLALSDQDDKSKLEDANQTDKLTTLGPSEKDQLLTNQVQVNNENYGTRKLADSQGKLNLAISDANNDDIPIAREFGEQLFQGDDSVADSNLTQLKHITVKPNDNDDLSGRDDKELDGDLSLDSTLRIDRSVSPTLSADLVSYIESKNVAEFVTPSTDDDKNPELAASSDKPTLIASNFTDDDYMNSDTVDQQQQSRYEPIASTSRNVPSKTKIGDYARIEYSPVEDLDSMTTMSHSRFGSEKGGSRSQTGSLSRRNSLRATTNDGSISRRSSQGGIESTSLSNSSQLSNEQFQQNLTNMLESVNTNYPTFGTIGLPLGPPFDVGYAETAKTSPETTGAALTSASQDSLSDASFGEGSPKRSRPATTLSDRSTEAALVGDSMERSNFEEIAKPAPLASGEDELLKEYPSVTSTLIDSNDARPNDRVGSPLSIATTNSGGLTNPTPTPSEMSSGSGKKKRLKAKALFKRFKPGSKKKKDEID